MAKYGEMGIWESDFFPGLGKCGGVVSLHVIFLLQNFLYSIALLGSMHRSYVLIPSFAGKLAEPLLLVLA